MSSLLLILSTFFDDHSGAGSAHKILSSCNCVLLKDCWIWWLVLMTEDSVDGCFTSLHLLGLCSDVGHHILQGVMLVAASLNKALVHLNHLKGH